MAEKKAMGRQPVGKPTAKPKKAVVKKTPLLTDKQKLSEARKMIIQLQRRLKTIHILAGIQS